MRGRCRPAQARPRRLAIHGVPSPYPQSPNPSTRRKLGPRRQPEHASLWRGAEMRLRVVAHECEHSKFEKRAVSENLTDLR